MSDIISLIRDKALSLFASEPLIEELPPSGSSRRYFRINSEGRNIIAAWNNDLRENAAFVYFSRFFFKRGLNVPEIIADFPSEGIYFITDLGNTTLYNLLDDKNEIGKRQHAIEKFYPTALRGLLEFQLSLNFNVDYCYPHMCFDKRSMMWDLNYFKYFFLKLNYIPFNENALENDFEAFTAFIGNIPSGFFMYRDFQSRNIMIEGEKLSYIDYQGGRFGPLQYDVASLLYDAKAGLKTDEREKLLNLYCSFLEDKGIMSASDFRSSFYHVVAIRIMQAMGAYGYRGYYERKHHFLLSVPPAVENLKSLLPHITDDRWPELSSIWRNIVTKLSKDNLITQSSVIKLKVEINSISLRNHYPDLNPDHGGGFVFDCRFLPNPGRIEKYKSMTGLDLPVIRYLKQQREVELFLADVFPILRRAVNQYLEREFTFLSITFGCTGGQHRSVYCAEVVRKMLVSEFNQLDISVNHIELPDIEKK